MKGERGSCTTFGLFCYGVQASSQLNFLLQGSRWRQEQQTDIQMNRMMRWNNDVVAMEEERERAYCQAGHT